jgi:hypothetical protein
VNVYVTSKINSKTAGRVLLGSTIIVLVVLYISLLILIDFTEMGKASIPIILIPTIFLFILSRYLLWNIYGEERIIINSKTLTYFYGYGFFMTNPSTISHNKLGLGFRITDNIDAENFGRMTFVSYSLATNLPENIHETAVEIHEETAAEIKELLSKVLFDEFNEKKGFSYFEN